MASEDARVLPSGRSRMSFIYGQSAVISQTFNGSGGKDPLASPYNRISLSSESLRTVSPEVKTLVDVLNTGFGDLRYDASQRESRYHGVVMSDDPRLPRLGDALSRGFLELEAEHLRKQYNLTYQFGVTERLSVGFGVPWVVQETSMTHGFGGNNTAGDLYEFFVTRGPSADGVDLTGPLSRIASVNDETFQKLLEQKGYARIENYRGAEIGDAILGARYNYLNTRIGGRSELLASLQTGVTLPTGRLSPPRNLTETDYGQGAWDIGSAHLVNYSPAPVLSFSHGAHYTYVFKSTRLKRVRATPDELIPDASDEENVAYRLGQKFWTSVGARLAFTRAFNIDFGYEWYWKRADVYAGNRKDRDYGYLSDNTARYLETLQLGANLSSVSAFLRRSFPFPGELSVYYYRPLRGRNSPIAPYGTAELALYF